jgi:hypothetical protein
MAFRGILKVPKGNKVRKGWKAKFAVIRDYKLYLFEREKDSENGEGTFVADLRYSTNKENNFVYIPNFSLTSAELFVVKGVTQSELIHANARDIDSIFKIQYIPSTSPTSSTTVSLICIMLDCVLTNTRIESFHRRYIETHCKTSE